MNQGTCPVCSRVIVLREADGMLRRHGFSLRRDTGHCAGSGRPPQPQPTTPTEHPHDRRTQ